MMEWIQTLTRLEQTFFVCAAVGGVLFLVQLVMVSLGGGDAGGDAGGDFGADAGGHFGDATAGGGTDFAHGAHHSGWDQGFKLLSYQGLVAFFMLFGLVGLAMSRGSGLGGAISVLGATAAGLLGMLLVAKIFRLFLGMQSSGTISLQNAVGRTGRVYLRIRAGAKGQVEVAFQGRLRVCDARSADRTEIPYDAQVEVTGIEGSTLIVKPLS